MPLNDNFIYQPPQAALITVYEDDDLIVIDKPSGLLSVMGRQVEHQDSAYLRILMHYPAAKVIHRLDMATSGLLMFAKHRLAEAALSKLFQARQVQKSYMACVTGQLLGHGCIDAPLICDWEFRPRQKVDWVLGKTAQTLYQALAYNSQLNISRVLLSPITGRSHQLRVHLAHIGHPIIGDQIYHTQPVSPLNRLYLHASELKFIHPMLHTAMALKASVPF